MTDRMMYTYLDKLQRQFVTQGGIKERMYAARTGYRKEQDRMAAATKAESTCLKAENEKLRAEVAGLRAENESLRAEVAGLRAENERLAGGKNRLALDKAIRQKEQAG